MHFCALVGDLNASAFGKSTEQLLNFRILVKNWTRSICRNVCGIFCSFWYQSCCSAVAPFPGTLRFCSRAHFQLKGTANRGQNLRRVDQVFETTSFLFSPLNILWSFPRCSNAVFRHRQEAFGSAKSGDIQYRVTVFLKFKLEGLLHRTSSSGL